MSDLDGIHLRQLAYLDAVTGSGSFMDAADALGVSQPALSQGLARLEALVGAPLFEVDGRRKRLTDLGRQVAEYASRVLGETRELDARLDERRLGRAGTLRVGMIDAAFLYLLEAGIARFRKERSNVDLRIVVNDSESLMRQMLGFEQDLVYVVAPVSAGAHEVVAAESLYIYGPPLPRSLEGLEWVLYPEGSHTRAAVDAALAAAGIAPTVVGESSNPIVLRQFVHLGMGWTVLPESIAESGPSPVRRRSDAIGERLICAAWRAETRDQLRSGFREVAEPDAAA
jgi:DNA-binding transcriptional LysR family regulator